MRLWASAAASWLRGANIQPELVSAGSAARSNKVEGLNLAIVRLLSNLKSSQLSAVSGQHLVER
jgi:hypothetical protein